MKFDPRIPIYIQLIEVFEERILNGTYQAGDVLPSRRDVAKEFGVNPNTVQRAFKEMEEQQFIVSDGRLQTKVTDDESFLAALRQRQIEKKTQKFVLHLKELGLSREAAHEAIDHWWEEKGESKID